MEEAPVRSDVAQILTSSRQKEDTKEPAPPGPRRLLASATYLCFYFRVYRGKGSSANLAFLYCLCFLFTSLYTSISWDTRGSEFNSLRWITVLFSHSAWKRFKICSCPYPLGRLLCLLFSSQLNFETSRFLSCPGETRSLPLVSPKLCQPGIHFFPFFGVIFFLFPPSPLLIPFFEGLLKSEMEIYTPKWLACYKNNFHIPQVHIPVRIWIRSHHCQNTLWN